MSRKSLGWVCLVLGWGLMCTACAPICSYQTHWVCNEDGTVCQEVREEVCDYGPPAFYGVGATHATRPYWSSGYYYDDYPGYYRRPYYNRGYDHHPRPRGSWPPRYNMGHAPAPRSGGMGTR